MTATTTPKTQPTAEDWIERARAINPRNEAFIDGRFVPAASGRTFDDIAGRDGRVITAVAEGGPEDIDRAVAAARASFDDRRWSDMSPAKRKIILLKLAESMRANRDELALLESLDLGKPIRDTTAIDVPSAGQDHPMVRRDDRRDKSLDALDGYTQLKTTWFDFSNG